MTSICLQVNTKVVCSRAKVTATMVCGLGLNLIPLLVDEGFLLVDLNGVSQKLLVKKR